MTPYYERAGITIYHGDCREILPQLPRADLVLTDPPYSHRHVGGDGFAAARAFYRDGALDGLNDFVLSDFAGLMLAAAPMLIAFHSRDLIPDYAALARASERRFDLHVWHKTNAIPFTANTWKSDLEYIALIWERKPGWTQLSQEMHSKAYVSAINSDGLHPAAKPIPLLYKYCAVLGSGLVVDPFAGSGTTLEAAKLAGRSAIGIEIEERYCEIAARRLGQEVFEWGGGE